MNLFESGGKRVSQRFQEFEATRPYPRAYIGERKVIGVEKLLSPRPIQIFVLEDFVPRPQQLLIVLDVGDVGSFSAEEDAIEKLPPRAR